MRIVQIRDICKVQGKLDFQQKKTKTWKNYGTKGVKTTREGERDAPNNSRPANDNRNSTDTVPSPLLSVWAHYLINY